MCLTPVSCLHNPNMNIRGCLLVFMVFSHICLAIPAFLLEEKNRLARRKPADDDEGSAEGVLLPAGDPDEDDDEDETTTARPRTTTRRPQPTSKDPEAVLDYPTTTRRPTGQGQRGARIVFQPLGVVAVNALTKGLTSAFLPILNNEQPTGMQYGSVPVDISNFPALANLPTRGSSSEEKSSSSSSRTSIVSSLMGFWGK